MFYFILEGIGIAEDLRTKWIRGLEVKKRVILRLFNLWNDIDSLYSLLMCL